jgi:hypothetical protein
MWPLPDPPIYPARQAIETGNVMSLHGTCLRSPYRIKSLRNQNNLGRDAEFRISVEMNRGGESAAVLPVGGSLFRPSYVASASFPPEMPRPAG